ncbi:hypothetical protein [Glutamicibacter arilaitensis]|uniref:hypothetical protein n=1 Tax=Glutamicibacter arilaitensis TaxID=256701 RepID=UPI003F8DE2AD
MSNYPTYTVAGINLSDPSGRWELTPETELLHRFPGSRATSWNVPGMPGDQQALYAPAQATTVTLKLRINAVGKYANTFVTGGRAARLKAISDNLDMLNYATALGRQSYNGMVEIRRYLSATDYRKAHARMVSASDIQFDPKNDYATVSMIYSIPSGFWLAPRFDVTRTTIKKANALVRIEVPAGTAPSLESMVCFKPPGTTAMESKSGHRVTVTGGNHGGFYLGTADKSLTLPAGKWTMINTLYWKYGFSTRSDDWGIAKPYKGLIEPTARPMGSALAIVPSTKKDVGYVYIQVPTSGTEVVLRTRKAWY